MAKYQPSYLACYGAVQDMGMSKSHPQCPPCGGPSIKYGTTSNKGQRFRCTTCRHPFIRAKDDNAAQAKWFAIFPGLPVVSHLPTPRNNMTSAPKHYSADSHAFATSSHPYRSNGSVSMSKSSSTAPTSTLNACSSQQMLTTSSHGFGATQKTLGHIAASLTPSTATTEPTKPCE